MVDPQPELEPYLAAAAQKALRITHVIETHVQADHLSGARALAEATGAAVCLHEAVEAAFPFQPLRDGDELALGNVVLRVWHTPGHTPEGISLVVTDRTRGDGPWFVLTGDTLFAGGVGRPDLAGDARERALAGDLYQSLRRLLTLPDHVEVYPAHFGGAACGKGLSGKPMTTIGFERRFNPALRLASPEEFVRFALEDLPPPPAAFAVNRARNLGRD
ncbi:MAG: MBL fold metallo-hydrolase [Candidatus Rokubacteria bacterium]|nr:MBL fold metallo-hydrolase [Candidatus Rokubacteria bacterium]